MVLLEKRAVFQCLGNLMKNPMLLEDDRFNFQKEDFIAQGESSFYVIIFAAISNLYNDGNEVIDTLSIDSFLSSYAKQYATFNENNGVEYLQNAVQETHERNLEYNYNKLKKYSLLRAYQKLGFDVSDIYDDAIMNPREQEEMMQEFEEMSVQDIIEHFEAKQIEIRNKFMVDSQVVSEKAGTNSKELFENFKKAPDYGVSLIGDIQNTIFRGGKLKTIGMRSAPSNLGKTRIALAEATDMAIDEIYDIEMQEWTPRNTPEKVLFISTEMERDRLEPTIWAYIAAVPEERIKDAVLTEEEEQRVLKAIDILDRSSLWIDYIPDFDTGLIETKIKQHILENGTQYIYFDYVHISMAIMQELAEQSRGMKMREDMVLFMFVNRLEQIAKQYNVWIQTASQVNGSWKEAEDADSTMLRGAKNMADKLFRGIIALTPTKKDLDAIKPILEGRFGKEPNVVYHIYKNRETRYKDCKLWLHIDMDTMRMEELFLTDNNYKPLNIKPTKIESGGSVQ